VKAPHQFLVDLAHFLPVATGAQLLRHYFGGNVEALHRALRAAKAKGFIEISTELVRPWSHGGAPIVRLKAGEPVLSAGQIAYQASQRWSPAPLPTLVIRGTASLATLHGGNVRSIVTGHLSHQIAVSEVFMNQRLQEPAFEWTLVRARPGAVAPDAIAGSLAYEILGRYSGATVQAKLTIGGSLNLELW
jgi:hypothetical protein